MLSKGMHEDSWNTGKELCTVHHFYELMAGKFPLTQKYAYDLFISPNNWWVTDMEQTEENSEARERVMNAAERLFAQRGYCSVTLRDIAAEIGIHHTTLYHHVPGGKEQLFIDVVERNFQHHRIGLTHAIESAVPDIRSRLRAIADWLLSQPPMDLVRMAYSDMPSIDPVQADRLSHMAFETMLVPIEAVLRFAQQQKEIDYQDLFLVAGTFIGLIESLYAVPQRVITKSRQSMAYEMIDILLNGLRPHNMADKQG
jgi:TetR/AcrR family transcriptional regulator, cholesterol catabolism regulator